MKSKQQLTSKQILNSVKKNLETEIHKWPNINLQFNNQNIDDQLLIKIADLIQKVTKPISSVHIDLSRNNIGNNGAIELFKVLRSKVQNQIKKGKNLNFYIDLSNNHVGDNAVESTMELYNLIKSKGGQIDLSILSGNKIKQKTIHF